MPKITYSGVGVGFLDNRYLRLDASNDPITGALAITPTVDGVSVFQVNKADTTPVFNVDTTNERVGIGTDSPDSAFHIKANIPGVVGNNYAGQIIIQNPANDVTSNVVITAYESDGSGNPDQQLWYLGSSSSSNSNIIFLNRRNALLQFGTNDNTQMTILGNGDVGIGGNPLAKLWVKGTADDEQFVVKAHSTQNANIVEIQDSGGNVMLEVDGEGHLGIGATPGTLNAAKIDFRITQASNNASGISPAITHTLSANNARVATALLANANLNQAGFNATASVGLVGTQGVASVTGSSGTVTGAVGGRFRAGNAGGGTLTNSYGAYLLSNINSGGGTLTNNYGWYIEDQLAGSTLNYAIYTNAGLVRLGDQLSVIGSQDAVQNIIKAHSTQTANVFEQQQSDTTVVILTKDDGSLVLGEATKQTNAGFLQIGGGWTFKETTAPTADAAYGKIWTQDNNELFYQSGDGNTHLLHGDAFSNMWFHAGSPDTVEIGTAALFTLIDSFENVGEEDDLGNAISNTTNNDTTIGAGGAGKYKITFHASISSETAASEMIIAIGITLNTPIDVTEATNATPIVVTSVAHGLKNGDMVTITGAIGNTNADGDWMVTAKADDTFTLVDIAGNDAVGNGVYTASSADVTIKYPGNILIHREVGFGALGVGGANADTNLAVSDKVKLYVANVTSTRDLLIAIVNMEIFRIGD